MEKSRENVRNHPLAKIHWFLGDVIAEEESAAAAVCAVTKVLEGSCASVGWLVGSLFASLTG